MEHIDNRIGQYLRRELTQAEEREFLSWLSEKPGNERHFEETKMIWEQARKIQRSFSPDVNEAWEHFLDKVGPAGHKSFYPLAYKWIVGIAASLLLMASVAYLIISKGPPVRYAADDDRKFDIELPDGSIIWLNRNSEITFNENKSSRNVALTGEAYFEINPDSERPFTINTNELTTLVAGTSFNIDATGKRLINVTVLSGKVLLFNNEKDSVYLTKGEVGSFDLSSKSLAGKFNTDPNFLSWKTGILTFDDTPMQRVIDLLEKHFDVSLEWDEANLSRLTATFDNQSLEEVISLITLTTDVEIRISETINETN